MQVHAGKEIFPPVLHVVVCLYFRILLSTNEAKETPATKISQATKPTVTTSVTTATTSVTTATPLQQQRVTTAPRQQRVTTAHHPGTT